MTLYDLLGVDEKATSEEIKQAYRDMIKAFHPDVYSGRKDFALKKHMKLLRHIKF